MKTIKDKQLLVGADFAGFPLKEAVCGHLRKKGWICLLYTSESFPMPTHLIRRRRWRLLQAMKPRSTSKI